jgi:hypothetical protein
VTFVTLAGDAVLVLELVLELVLVLPGVLLELDDPPLLHAATAATAASRAAPSTLILRHRMTCPMGRSIALKVRVPLTVGQPFGSRNAGRQQFFIAEQVKTFLTERTVALPQFSPCCLGWPPNRSAVAPVPC